MVSLRSGSNYQLAIQNKPALAKKRKAPATSAAQNKAEPAKKRNARVASASSKAKNLDAAISNHADSDHKADKNNTAVSPTNKRKLGASDQYEDSPANMPSHPDRKRIKLSKKQLSSLPADKNEYSVAASALPPAVSPTSPTAGNDESANSHENSTITNNVPMESASNPHEGHNNTNDANPVIDALPMPPESDAENESVDLVTESHVQTTTIDAEDPRMVNDASSMADDTIKITTINTYSEADINDSVEFSSDIHEQTTVADISGLATDTSPPSLDTNTNVGVTVNATDVQEPTRTTSTEESIKAVFEDATDESIHDGTTIEQTFTKETATEEFDAEEAPTEQQRKQHASDDPISSSPKWVRHHLRLDDSGDANVSASSPDPLNISEGNYSSPSPLQSNAEPDDDSGNFMVDPSILYEDRDEDGDAESVQFENEQTNLTISQYGDYTDYPPSEDEGADSIQPEASTSIGMSQEANQARRVRLEGLSGEELENEEAWADMFSALPRLEDEIGRGREEKKREREEKKRERREEEQRMAEEEVRMTEEEKIKRAKLVERINKTAVKNGFAYNKPVGYGWAFKVARDAGIDIPDEYPGYDPFTSDEENGVNSTQKKKTENIMPKIRAAIAEEMNMDPEEVQLPVDRESIDVIAQGVSKKKRDNARTRRRFKLMDDLRDSAQKGIGRIDVEEALDLSTTPREAWVRTDTIKTKNLYLNQAFSDVLIHVLRENHGWKHRIPWEARIATIAMEEWSQDKPCTGSYDDLVADNEFKSHPGLVKSQYRHDGLTEFIYHELTPEALWHCLVSAAKEALLDESEFRELDGDYTTKAWGGKGQEDARETPEGVLAFIEEYANIVVSWALRKEGKLREGLPKKSWEQSRAGETVTFDIEELRAAAPFDQKLYLPGGKKVVRE